MNTAKAILSLCETVDPIESLGILERLAGVWLTPAQVKWLVRLETEHCLMVMMTGGGSSPEYRVPASFKNSASV
jgi:hypothetical protein